MNSDVILAVALLGLLAASLEAGFRAGRRAITRKDAPSGTQIGTVQAGTLGLLGLLLAFSFGGAATRFLERQNLIVQEANAIGTAYLRADLLDEPHRSELRASLAAYLDHRIRISSTLRHGLSPDAESEIARLHERIWTSAKDGAIARPASTIAVLPPVNEVIDLHTTRRAAGMRHLPPLLLGLLLGCSAMSMVVVGYGCGLAGRRVLMMTGSLAVLIACSLWATIDLDYPRAGLIQLSDAPLKWLDLGPPS